MSAHQIPPCTNSNTHSETEAKVINRIINHKYCFRGKNVTHTCQVRQNISPLCCFLKACTRPCFEPLYNKKKAGVCNRWEHCQQLKSKTWSVSSPDAVIVIHLHVMIPLNTSYRRQQEAAKVSCCVHCAAGGSSQPGRDTAGLKRAVVLQPDYWPCESICIIKVLCQHFSFNSNRYDFISGTFRKWEITEVQLQYLHCCFLGLHRGTVSQKGALVFMWLVFAAGANNHRCLYSNRIIATQHHFSEIAF